MINARNERRSSLRRLVQSGCLALHREHAWMILTDAGQAYTCRHRHELSQRPGGLFIAVGYLAERRPGRREIDTGRLRPERIGGAAGCQRQTSPVQ